MINKVKHGLNTVLEITENIVGEKKEKTLENNIL